MQKNLHLAQNNKLLFTTFKVKKKIECAAVSTHTNCIAFTWDGSICSCLSGTLSDYEASLDSTLFCYEPSVNGMSIGHR